MKFCQVGQGHMTKMATMAINSHYENSPMQYLEIFKIAKNENFQ